MGGGRAFLRVSRAKRDRRMRVDDDDARGERGTADESRRRRFERREARISISGE